MFYSPWETSRPAAADDVKVSPVQLSLILTALLHKAYFVLQTALSTPRDILGSCLIRNKSHGVTTLNTARRVRRMLVAPPSLLDPCEQLMGSPQTGAEWGFHSRGRPCEHFSVLADSGNWLSTNQGSARGTRHQLRKPIRSFSVTSSRGHAPIERPRIYDDVKL